MIDIIQHHHTTLTNPYKNLYIDLTERCNMTCRFCFNPDRVDNNINVDQFEQMCAQLKNKVDWRFLGGEPTLHPHFFKLVDIALNYGHTVFFATNGIKLNDLDFVRELSKRSGKIVVGLSMDGGSLSDESYELINDRPVLEMKLQALKNLQQYNITRVCLTAIIVRGWNENVIAELWELAQQHDVVRYIHYRTAAKLGRWVDIEPYTLQELKTIVADTFTPTQMIPKCVGEINCNGGDGDCCYRFRPTPRMQVSLIEFASERSAECPHRGKVEWNGSIKPFFANMRETRS